MSFTYYRTVYFGDTDAAGVMYFANLLVICHEAYEASLAAAGVELGKFFHPVETAVPITHTQADFLSPLKCGDRLAVHLIPKLTNSSQFEIEYELTQSESNRLVGRALTRHVCINIATRKRQPLTVELIQWLHQGSDHGSD